MKNELLKIATIVLFGILIISCNKNDDTPAPSILPVSDVFAIGQANVISSQGFYYKNDIKTILPVATNEFPTIRRMFVSGNDVYTIGNIRTGGAPAPSITQACYWKNNVKFNLPPVAGAPVTLYSEAYAITIVNGDVYIVGFSATNGSSKRNIIVWKNGIASAFASSPTISYSPFAISVFNNDIYVAGDIDDSVTPKAAFWKNGVLTIVSTLDTFCNDITVNQNGIHIMFTEYPASSAPRPIKYWKDGVVSTITSQENMAGQMTVKGTDVYITGGESETGSSNYKAFYWKNGMKFQLPNGNGLIATDIRFGINGDIFMASKPQFGGLVPLTYWKNNIKATIGNSGEYMIAFDINNK